MATKKRRLRKPVNQELDMADHASRLRSLPANPWEAARGILIWLAAGVVLFALGWLALGR
ncbi:hypothetical protein K8S19_00030 [bacterium]|nr:hypothetical protein [bacterium]